MSLLPPIRPVSELLLMLSGLKLSFPLNFAIDRAAEGKFLVEELERRSGKKLKGTYFFGTRTFRVEEDV